MGEPEIKLKGCKSESKLNTECNIILGIRYMGRNKIREVYYILSIDISPFNQGHHQDKC